LALGAEAANGIDAFIGHALNFRNDAPREGMGFFQLTLVYAA